MRSLRFTSLPIPDLRSLLVRTLVALCSLVAAGSTSLAAQSVMSSPSSADKDAVYAVIVKLFDGMRTRDTAAMRASFVPNASMQSLTPQGVKFDSIDGWVNSIGRARAGLVLDERLANPIIQVNGDLASVWVVYWFFIGDRLSHCGVDAIHLARQAGNWRIFSIVDTRQQEGCPTAPAGTKTP
jgi:hypothetical protein